MLQTTFNPVFIIALNGLSETNEHILLKTHGIKSFSQVEGVYTHDDGTKVSERSYIVSALHSVAVYELAKQTGQESVLHLGGDANRPATLIYTADKKRVPLGDFIPVSKRVALTLPAYTFDKANNTYFAAK